MNKASRRVIIPFVIFMCQWLIWGLLHEFAIPLLPSGAVTSFIEGVVLKAVVWALPFGLMMLFGKQKTDSNDLFKIPFPWFACVVLLCLTTAFLYTVRLSAGLVNTFMIFRPIMAVLSIGAGVIEEFSFRGGLFRMQESALGFWPAAVINGILFTLYHYPGLIFGDSWAVLLSWRGLLIFVMGIVFCWMFRKWRNLALNMTVHTVWDVLSYLFCIAG